MILARTRVANGRKIVAVCDSELLGKKFEEKGLQIDLTGEFYKGEEVGDEKLMLKDAYVAEFVGEDSVAFGIGKRHSEKGERHNGFWSAEGAVFCDGINFDLFSSSEPA